MASKSKFKVEDLITCPICFELFDDPRLTSCSHTFCSKCIEKMAYYYDDPFECPSCDGCKIYRTDIGSLPSNQKIQDLIELFRSSQRLGLCTCCQLIVAECGCNRCENEKFCSDCYEKEHMSRLMQKHQKLPISDVTYETVSCKEHPKKPIEYFCEACQTTICMDCLVFEHRDHTRVAIHVAANKCGTKMNADLQSIQSSLEHMLTETQMLIDAVQSESKRHRSSVAETMTSLRRMINDHEKAMIKEISATAAQQTKTLEDYRTPLKAERHSWNLEKATFDLLLSTKNYIQLLDNEQKFDQHVTKTNETLQSREGPTRTEYRLEKPDQLSVVKQNISQCGRYVEVPQYQNEASCPMSNN